MDFLRKVVGNYFDLATKVYDNFNKPIVNFVRKVPLLGGVVEGVYPIANAAWKAQEFAADELLRRPKKRPAPTSEEWISAAKSLPNLATLVMPGGGVMKKAALASQALGGGNSCAMS